jgi:hypothetical protein
VYCTQHIALSFQVSTFCLAWDGSTKAAECLYVSSGHALALRLPIASAQVAHL